MTKVLLVAAGALVNKNKEVLLSKRPEGKNMAGFWEFPGGKIEPDETPEDALVRELKEELGLVLNPKSLIPVSFASFAYPEFHLLMPLFACFEFEGTPTPMEKQEIDFVSLEALEKNREKYPLPPADACLIQALIKTITHCK